MLGVRSGLSPCSFQPEGGSGKDGIGPGSNGFSGSSSCNPTLRFSGFFLLPVFVAHGVRCTNAPALNLGGVLALSRAVTDRGHRCFLRMRRHPRLLLAWHSCFRPDDRQTFQVPRWPSQRRPSSFRTDRKGRRQLSALPYPTPALRRRRLGNREATPSGLRNAHGRRRHQDGPQSFAACALAFVLDRVA